MYKELNETIKKLGLKKKDISKYLGYANMKTLSIRLNGNTKFNDEEINKITSFLSDNGYSDIQSNLFDYSISIKKPKESRTRTSKIIRERIKELGFSNKDIANELKIDIATIDNWRNGRAEPHTYYIDPLCKLLDISPLYLLGDDSKSDTGYISSTYSNYHNDKESIKRTIYEQLLNFQNSRGYKLSDIPHLNDGTYEEMFLKKIEKFIEKFSDSFDGFFYEHMQNNVEIQIIHDEINHCEKALIESRIDSLLSDNSNITYDEIMKKTNKAIGTNILNNDFYTYTKNTYERKSKKRRNKNGKK